MAASWPKGLGFLERESRPQEKVLLAAYSDQEKRLKAEGLFAVQHGHIRRLQAQLWDA